MNTTRSHPLPAASTRPICRMVRQWAAITGQETTAHTGHCAECQKYFSGVLTLESALRRDARESRAHAAIADTHRLEEGIMRSVRGAAADSAGIPARSFRSWAVGVVGIAAAAVVAVLSFGPQGARPTVEGRSTAPAEEVAVILTTVESLSNGLVDKVIPSAGELVAENPLQREFGSVYSDVRSAIDFLALNFLPATRVTAEPVPARQI